MQKIALHQMLLYLEEESLAFNLDSQQSVLILLKPNVMAKDILKLLANINKDNNIKVKIRKGNKHIVKIYN